MKGRRVGARVERGRCAGSATCVRSHPQIFALRDGKADLLVDPDDVAPEQLWAAAEECPTAAIVLEDPETGEALFPDW